MSKCTERYDTLVIRGSTSTEVPREAAGGEVVAWSAGHSLAEYGPLEEFVTDLADGAFSSVDAIEAEAWRVLEVSRHQREHGWPDEKKKSQEAELHAEPQETLEELRAGLQRECQRYNDLYLRHVALVDSTRSVTADMTVMCEAYLAGDNSTVVAKVRGFALAYQQHTKPTDGRVH